MTPEELLSVPQTWGAKRKEVVNVIKQSTSARSAAAARGPIRSRLGRHGCNPRVPRLAGRAAGPATGGIREQNLSGFSWEKVYIKFFTFCLLGCGVARTQFPRLQK